MSGIKFFGPFYLCLILLSCGRYNTGITYAKTIGLPLAESEEVVIIDDNRNVIPEARYLGHFKIEQIAGGLNCSYDSVRRLAIEKCKSIGGNGILITSHRYPNQEAPCHGIFFNVYELEDTEQFKKESHWQEGKKLDSYDFKGDFRSKPINASTLSYIRHYVWRPENSEKPIIEIETVFDNYQSYLKADAEMEVALRHEQVHFDITELYARKFTKLLKRKVRSYEDYTEKQEALFKEVETLLFSKQKEYDASVYNHPEKLEDWENWVSKSLREYQKYSNKVIRLKR